MFLKRDSAVIARLATFCFATVLVGATAVAQTAGNAPQAAPVPSADNTAPQPAAAATPAGDSATPLPAAPPAATISPQELRLQIARRIDTMDVSDLKMKMARAQAVLSLDGQAMLKDRALMRRDYERASATLKELDQDTRLNDVEKLLADEGFRSALLQAIQLPDERARVTAVMDILKKNQVDISALRKLVGARKVRTDMALFAKGLAGLEKHLDAMQQASGGTDSGVEIPYSAAGTDLAARWAGDAPGPAGTQPIVSANDLTSLLKALLMAPASAAAPAPSAGAAPAP